MSEKIEPSEKSAEQNKIIDIQKLIDVVGELSTDIKLIKDELILQNKNKQENQITVRYYNKPDDIVRYAAAFVHVNFVGGLQNCNYNARACWASMTSQNFDIVSGIPDYTKFLECDITELNTIKQIFRENKNAQMIIRFKDEKDNAEGHSLVLFKRDNIVSTFQAYQNVSNLEKKDGDYSENAIAPLEKGKTKKLNAKTFGINFDSKDWTCTKCYYIIDIVESEFEFLESSSSSSLISNKYQSQNDKSLFPNLYIIKVHS